MKILSLTTLISIVLLAVSCSGTRNLKQAELPMPEKSDIWTGDSLSVADVEWWKFYSDSTLCNIIRATLANNRNLQIAKARVDEVAALYGVEKLNYMPTVTAIAGATRETNDYHGSPFKRSDEISLKATVSWEIDLWGGLSSARQAAKANYMAAVEEQRAMEITLIAEAATAYINLVALENELVIVKQTLKTREEALEKAKLRYEGGLTSEIVYQQSKVELATTAALVPGLVRKINLARNAITLLMGQLPEDDIDIHASMLNTNLPRRMPAGLPSDLLERRPDLKARENRLKAALAEVGVSYSNRFPRLRIGLTGGWENDDLTSLLKSPFSYLLGNITGTVLDFGRNKRKYKAKIAAYEQARLGYEQTVLAAFTEVSNAVVTYREMLATADKREELRDAAFNYVDLANKQYIGGTINYIDVLDAQRRYFDAQISFSNAVRDEYLALVTLYKTLGGGWSTSDINR